MQSFTVIAFILGMVIWFAFYFKRHMDEDEKRSKNRYFCITLFDHPAKWLRMRVAEHSFLLGDIKQHLLT
ncbi:MAG: DUF3149 domain-containing protein [Methylophilaceae bacterium]